ncbi:GTP-binding protein [Microbacterium sp. NPDC077184]|uniref:GTP-binding protein n=1 Tax=Microbacterium sp. NPDC077184 TaxID=3154764 RepID=UPI00342C53CC
MSRQTITVIGVCAAQRRAYASELAAATARRAVTIETHDEAEITRAVDRGEALVLDLETDVDPAPFLDIAGDRVVCVVDARHMFDDLRDLAPLCEGALPGDPRGDIGARARRAVHALECAHVIILVEWQRSSTTELSMMMALASHLNPGARIRLSRGALADLRASGVDEPVGPWRDRAGWALALNGEHDPYMTDPRVRTLRYEQLRPFHPTRLVHALDDLESGRHGVLLRSAGLCRLATRPGVLARWEQVGSAMWIDPLDQDEGWVTTGQELALIGVDLHGPRIFSALDDAALSDDELAAGPRAWAGYDDPLPVWPARIDER